MAGEPEDGDSSDLLTVEERFFLHIARKNGLLTAAQVDDALALCRARDLPLEEVLRAQQLLDEAQIRRVREAMAASQVVRLDAVYADVALQRGLVARQAVDECFAEQRRQRYRVRLGNLLVERGHLKPDLHRVVITEVIRRLKLQGPGAYGSQVERRGDAAADSALQPRAPGGPPAAVSIPLDGSLPDAEALVAPPRGRPSDLGADPSSGGGTAVGWAATTSSAAAGTSSGATAAGRGPRGAPPPPPRGAASSSPFADSGETGGVEEDPLLTSAIRAGLSSDEHAIPLHMSDEAASQRDLLAASGDRPPPSLDRAPALDPAAASGEASAERAGEASAEGAAERPPARIGPLVLVLLVVSLAVAGAGAVVVLALSHRGALARGRALLARAEAEAAPSARQALYQQAADELAAAEGVGGDAAALADALAHARWGALEAEARVALAAGREDEARALLDAGRAALSPAFAEAHANLRRDAARAAALRAGREAEARGDLAAAVAAFRDARDQGDPGGTAGSRLQALRADLARRVEAAWQRAREGLEEADEAAYAAQAKLVTELFNEDPGVTERLDELRFRRALRRGAAALQRDPPDLDAAQAQLDAARRARPADPEVAAALERLAARRKVADEARRGREAEAGKRFDEAAEFFRRAAELAAGAERDRLLADARRCEEQGGTARERERRKQRGLEAVARLRESKVAEARAILEELVAGGGGETPRRLLELARRVDGMVLVPGGPFRMGSAPGPKVKALETPARDVDVPAFFIDRTEVTNAAYAKFVEATGAPAPKHWTVAVRDGSGRRTFEPGIAEHPVVEVTWTQAKAYAEWRGGRLPTEAEWEKAARGADGRTYPWGEGTARANVAVPPDPRRTHLTAPVGTHAADTSPFGVMDMAGNVNEWTADVLAPYPGAPPGVDLRPGRRAIRGGAFRWTFDDARCAARDGGEEGYSSNTVGFRVALDVPAELASILR